MSFEILNKEYEKNIYYQSHKTSDSTVPTKAFKAMKPQMFKLEGSSNVSQLK